MEMKKEYYVAHTVEHNGIKIPYYHFVYFGEFHKILLKRNRKHCLRDGTDIREFFNKISYHQYDFSGNYTVFEKAILITIHYFENNIERDLDNLNYKPLIDGIRKTGIIKDDSWQHLSFMHFGNLIPDEDEDERIEVYVIPQSFLVDFLLTGKITINLSEKHFFEITNREEVDLMKKESLGFW
jgi:hypothetical protein